jgi:hypothetical protein
LHDPGGRPLCCEEQPHRTASVRHSEGGLKVHASLLHLLLIAANDPTACSTLDLNCLAPRQCRRALFKSVVG